jgi:hypothetical protein
MHWQILCKQIHGRSHHEIFEMLTRRRLSRKCLRVARRQLTDALENWCPFESAFVEAERLNVPPTAQIFADLAKLVTQ